MSISISPTDSYRVFQRDLSSGNPPGSTTTYDKGWGEVDLQVASDTSSPVSYQIVDAENPSRVIQDWTATGQQAAAGTSVIKLQIPASQDCYIVKLAPTADLSSAASSTPFFMGNVDAAAGQSKATVMFSSYAYGATDPAAQPEQYVPFSFSSRVYSAVTNDPTSSTPESWLPPGNVNTPGGAVQTTFAAEYLADRQAELGVACALVGLDVPGSSVNNWEPGSSAYFYLAATLERAGGKISNFIWNQGDSDWNTAGAATYQQKFETLTNALDQVVTGSYRVIGFDYSWVGGSQPDRFITEVDQAKAAVADAHGGSFVEGVSAGDDYVGGHPSMQSRLLAADDLFRQILSLDNPDADKGPSLTGLGFLEGNTVTIRVSEDKGSNLIGQVIQFGSPEVTYRTATPEELSSQFSVYYRDFTDAAHRIPVLSAEILSSTEIRLTLSSQPSGPVDVWYRADYDGGTGNPNAVIRDDDTSDGIAYGHGLQTRLTPIQVSYQPSNGQSPPSPTMDTLGGSQVPNSVTIPGSTATNPGTGTTGATIPPQVSVPVPSPTSPSSSPVLEIDVSEDAWQGDAQFSVTVDGQQVGGIYTASASHGLGQTQAITIPTSLSAGSHALSISFLNDAYGGSADADRNLYVDGVKVDGTAIANGSATEMSDGAASFTLTVPAGSASSTIPGSTATNPGTGTTGATTPPQVSVPVPSPTSPSSSPVLEIDVSEDAWQGDAQFSVTVDGQQVGGIYTASASHGLGQTQAITIPTSLSAGSHALSISFLNDAYGGSADADRNLYVDGVKVDGTAIANGSATEMSDGAASFTLTVPAGSASSTIPGSTATNPGTGTTGATIPPQVSVPVPSPTSPSSSPVLEIDVSEDAWQGDAQFSVTVDGQQVGGIYTASASHGLGQTQAITIPTSLSAGSHALSISFLNDAYGGSADADRNLYVDGVKVDGTAIANGSATEMSDGAASFTLTVPAGSASSTIPGSTATNPGTGTTGATTPPQVSVPVPSPTSPSSSPVLEIDVSEDAWQGDAQFSVTVDGQQVGGIYTASASHGLGQTQAITIPTSLSAGSHALSISFLNDAYGGSADADRNLYVDGVKVDGTAIANGSATEMSDGAASFTLTVPAGSASSTIPGSTATNPGTGTTGATTPPQVSVPVPSPTSPSSSPVLEIDVSEDAWQGDAQFSVTVDGQQVGGIYTASASHGLGQTQAITIPTSLSAGSHALSISFLNDAYGGSADADRNLYVDGVKVDGTAIANGSATEMSDGAASFTLTVPAGSASSTIPGSTATNPGTGTTGATIPPQVSVPVPSPTSPSSSPVLEIDVSEDAWQGDAQFSVTVDGQQVGGIYTASASHGLGQTQAITIPTSLSAGSHALSISFLNDAYGGSADADRNLYVDGVKVDGTAIANGSATEMSDGAASFTLTVPADSASSTIPGSTATNPGTGTTGATTPPQQLLPQPDVSGAGLLTSPAIFDPQSSRVLTVGQGKQYTTIAEAVAASQDGDFIQVDAGTYTNDFLQTTTRLTIVGVGGMVNMVATELCPNGKAILTVDNDLTLANFTFTGAKVTDGNGAGIRYESGTLNLINDAFYGNQNGILGGVTNGTVSIRNSLFSGNGSGTGYTHNLYIGQSAQLTVTDSIFENASVGHELKSRALINVITNSIFRDGPTGTASYDIDLPDGGNATIKNNLIEKGPLASNNAMIHFGGEGLPYPSSSLTITGNSFVNDKGSSTVAVRNETLAVSTITENTFVNLLASQLSSGAANLTDNQDGRGSPIQDSTANSFPSATSIMFTDTASHSVVLDGSPLLNVAGGSGHLDVIAQAGRTLTIGGSGGLNFSEQGTSGANQITTKAGTTNTLNLIGEDIVASNGDDTITTGDESVTGSISGAAHIESGTGYDHWAVTGELSLHINGGAPNITLSSNASALITGVASGLNLTSDGGTVSVDITQEGGELAGEHISFSIASGSTSASVYNGGTGIATASGLQGASIRLGDGVEQVTSNGTDEIWAGTGADTVIVSGVNTIVHGGAGVLSVFGRGIPAGDDAKVYAQGGTINIDGDSGHIIYFGGDQANSVNADLSNISLLGGAGLMTIHNQAYSENINGGSGGIDYKAVGSASGSITTALGSINLIDLGDNPDITVDSWGTDTITGGSGTLTVHGNAIISGASGSRTLTLMGSDVLNGVGHDTVNVTQGANVTYNIGQSGTLTETSATVRASVLGSAAGSATVVGGRALLLGDTQTGLMISTGNTGNAFVELNAGDARVETGSADTIQAFGQQATIDIMSSNVRVVSGDGTIRLASQGYNYTGLQFAAGSGKAELLLADGGGDSITFGAGLTSVSVSGGQGNNFSFFAGQGGGSNEITGFRAGTDQILLHGVEVASEQTTGGSLSVTLSDQSQLQLIGLTSDHGVFA